MQFLYLLIVKIAGLLLPLASFFAGKGKIREFAEGRKHSRQVLPKKRSIRYWFHCASLGEFEQARPVMEKLKSLNRDCSIVITFFSPSGYKQKHNYPLADAVLYLPLDTPGNASKLLNSLEADVAVFVKYEIWYYHLRELFRREIPVYLISSTFRPNQFLFSMWGGWLFELLPKYEAIFLQDEKSFELLKNKGLNNVILSGDTRYDRVRENALQVKENEFIKNFKGGYQMMILGSSWPAEEDILLEYLSKKGEYGFKIVIAPHDISEGHIDEINKKFEKYNPVLYTENKLTPSSDILILNTIGHLASAYYYADMAFVGGAFGKGLHNILEPLAFGAPVIFGPNYAKYPEATQAMEHEVAISIRDLKGFENAVSVFSDTSVMVKCIDFINWNSGATDLVIKRIRNRQAHA
jgi:3-deoxy-D-manno-octulosonic-acid transferase